MSNGISDIFGIEPFNISGGGGGGSPSGPASGDLAANFPNPTVVKIQGQPVSNTAPVLGQNLTWNGSSWVPTNISASNITTGTLPAAQLPIVPKNKGGFGQDVSTGLTDGNIVAVSGGTITFGPIPLITPSNLAPGTIIPSYYVFDGGTNWVERIAGERVQLAMLTDPFYNNTYWFPSQFITLDTVNKTYSSGFWDNTLPYSPEADKEKLTRFSIKLSAPNVNAFNVSIWVRPLGGFEADTGITIPVSSTDTFAQNLLDSLTLNAGDEIKFTTDTFVGVQWISIFAHRIDNT